MTTAIVEERSVDGSWPLHQSEFAFQQLAELVRQWCPDVVLLVARKMPRLAQVRAMEFGAPAVMTDLAVPFSGSALNGARVAIVDDIVNVGSTLLNARDAVTKCGATQVRLFALGLRSNETSKINPEEIELVLDQPMGFKMAQALAAEVPRLLKGLPRPFDLDFPVIQCVAVPPFSDLADVARGLADRLGSSATRDISTLEGIEAGVRRFSIELEAPASGWLAKLRLYGQPGSPTFWLVPMAIPPSLRTSAAAASDPVWSMLRADASPGGAQSEPGARATMFCLSLDHGLRALGRVQDVVQPADAELIFDRAEATLAFGSAVAGVTVPVDYRFECLAESAASSGDECTSFIDEAHRVSLPVRVSERANVSEPSDLVVALFEELAVLVGAQAPEEYELDWPFSRREIAENPYLRLRVGVSWSDLVALVREAALLKDGSTASERCSELVLSTILDRLIDGGSVVPTFARLGGEWVRVYRKGESDAHEPVIEKVGYAWAAYGRPLSMTRVTKILTVLALAPDARTPFSVAARERGNVACTADGVLDESVEIARYMRDTGRLRGISSTAELRE